MKKFLGLMILFVLLLWAFAQFDWTTEDWEPPFSLSPNGDVTVSGDLEVNGDIDWGTGTMTTWPGDEGEVLVWDGDKLHWKAITELSQQ